MAVGGFDQANSSVGVTVVNNPDGIHSTVTWASNPNSTAWGFSRSLGFQNTGKIYFEFTTIRGPVAGDGLVVGLVTSTMPTDGSALVGSASEGSPGVSVGIGWENSAVAFMNGGVLSSFNNYIATFGAPLTCGIAVDFTNALWWTQAYGPGQSGVWSGFQALMLDPRFPPGLGITEPTPGNPTTGYNGIQFQNITSGPNFYAAIGFKTLLDSVSINFTGNTPPPPGFPPWVPPVPPVPPTPPTPSPAPASTLGQYPPFGNDYPTSIGPIPPVLYD